MAKASKPTTDEPKAAKPAELYKSHKQDPLECDCEDSSNHTSYVDANGETVIECSKCKRFLKFPK